MAAVGTDWDDFLDRVPVCLVEWEPGTDEKVILLVPKFRQRHLSKWLLPMLAKPAVRVHLDQIGSLVWRSCDGSKRVGEICREVSEAQGGDPNDWCDRVVRFFRQLEKERFVRLDRPETGSS